METNSKGSLHVCCNSLPSAPHPLVSQFYQHLHRLTDPEATSSLQSSSQNNQLNHLQDLHDCTDKLLQLPTTQQALSRECSEKYIDNLLNGSLRLLDNCSLVKDCLLQSKESLHELQSVIRRRRGADSGFTVEGGKYLASRKKIKKAIQKALTNVKETRNGIRVSSSNSNIDNQTLSMHSILKEAEAITVSSLESLLLFISDSKGQSKQSKWAVISKLMHPARVASDSQESDTNQFEKVDAALQSLISHKPSSIDKFQRNMENLEMCIQDLETGVEHLSRKLIRTRVSLLNIFNL